LFFLNGFALVFIVLVGLADESHFRFAGITRSEPKIGKSK
jgi:hypothetical protein